MSTIHSSVLSLENITENWIADRTIAPGILGLLSTAPADYCVEVVLPKGSTWVEARVSLLDACDGLPANTTSMRCARPTDWMRKATTSNRPDARTTFTPYTEYSVLE